ncbi:MAG: efflux RND transporter periplasmic adaptor subunit [Fusicatenibacter sp.]
MKTRKPKIRQRIILITSILFSIVLQACALSETPEMKCPPVPVYEEPAYETALCQRMTIRDTRTIRFSYHAAREETLFYPVEGIHYSAFFVVPGTAVLKGDLLCELDLENYPELLSEAEATLLDLQQEQVLLEENLALSLKRESLTNTETSKRERQNTVNEINLRYTQKRTELEDRIYILQKRMEEYQTVIRERQLYAPFDGTVTYVYSPGSSDLSQKGQRIVTVTDDSQMLFTAETEYSSYFLPDTEYLLSINGEDRITVPVFPEEESSPNTVFLALKVPDYDLEDGVSGTLELSLEEKDQVLGIPKKALSSINGKPIVYLLGEDGFRTYQEVNTGIEGPYYTEIISGLEEGDEILLPD